MLNSVLFTNHVSKGIASRVAALILLTLASAPAIGAVRGIYVGDDFYPPKNNVAAAKVSGFNTFFLFALHVYENGDLYYNDTPVVQNGVYVGDTNWGTLLASLKPAISRTEMVIGGWGDMSFDRIRNLIAAEGTGPDSLLYKNFLALKNATGIDAIQYDDEHVYDVPSSVAFGNMIAALGMKVTLCPYTAQSYWAGVKTQLGDKVDAIYLQCYDGGAGNINSVGSWINAFGGFKVYPGLWGNTSEPPDVTARMRNWQQTLGITGGFMWLNGGMPSDALKWGQSLAFGLEPLNGLVAADSAANYSVTGFTGNQGFGFGPWVMSTTGGGAYISGDSPAHFGLWNGAANGRSTATRSLNTPLAPGQSLRVQLRMNGLDSPNNTNAFQLLDSSGNLLFSYYHVGGDNADGHYSDDSGTHPALGFAYDYAKTDTFTFVLKTGTTYTFIDNTTGSRIDGTIAAAPIAQVRFLRANGGATPPNGQDFKFDGLRIFVPTTLPIGLTPSAAGWKISFAGTPGFTYRVQRATSLTGSWTDIGTVAVLFNSGEFTDSNPPDTQAFYRTFAP